MFNNKKKNVLIVGSRGMLGTDVTKIFKYWQAYGCIDRVVAYEDVFDHKVDGHYDFDPKDFISLISGNGHFTHVVNCLAYTDTVGCEKGYGRIRSLKANAAVPGLIASACAAQKRGIKLVHVSTNEVFSIGKSSNAKLATDRATSPISVYGCHKDLGERNIAAEMKKDDYAILRTSWLYGTTGAKSFVHKALRSLAKAYFRGETAYGVVNDFGTPTSTELLSRIIFETVKNDVCGIHHAVLNSSSHSEDVGGCISRYDWMSYIKDNCFFKLLSEGNVPPPPTDDEPLIECAVVTPDGGPLKWNECLDDGASMDFKVLQGVRYSGSAMLYCDNDPFMERFASRYNWKDIFDSFVLNNWEELLGWFNGMVEQLNADPVAEPRADVLKPSTEGASNGR